jgi:hypothetical protein
MRRSFGLHADNTWSESVNSPVRPVWHPGRRGREHASAGRRSAAAPFERASEWGPRRGRGATRRAATEDGGGEQEACRAAWFLGKRSSRRRRMTKHQNNPDNRHPGSSVKREADDDQACNRDPGIRPARLRARCGMDASTTRRRIDDRQRPERGSGRDRLQSPRHGCRSHRGVTESS